MLLQLQFRSLGQVEASKVVKLKSLRVTKMLKTILVVGTLGFCSVDAAHMTSHAAKVRGSIALQNDHEILWYGPPALTTHAL